MTAAEQKDAYILFVVSYPETRMTFEEFIKLRGTVEVWVHWLRELRVKPSVFFAR